MKMIKSLPLAGALLLIASLSFAWQVEELPISGVGTTPSTDVALTTYTWTKCSSVSSASKVSQRSGVILCNPSSNSGDIHYIWSASAPTVATTTIGVEIEPGESRFASCDGNLDVYALTKHTSTENVGTTEVKQ